MVRVPPAGDAHKTLEDAGASSCIVCTEAMLNNLPQRQQLECGVLYVKVFDVDDVGCFFHRSI